MTRRWVRKRRSIARASGLKNRHRKTLPPAAIPPERPPTKTHRQLRLEAIEKLGGRCSNPACDWLNEDGSRGCTHPSMLDIDHKSGNGGEERKQKGPRRIIGDILRGDADLAGYQLLCCNCHRIKTLAELAVRKGTTFAPRPRVV